MRGLVRSDKAHAHVDMHMNETQDVGTEKAGVDFKLSCRHFEQTRNAKIEWMRQMDSQRSWCGRS